MISGQSLFLFDQRMKTGSKTALTYRRQAARLLRNSPEAVISPELVKRVDVAVADALDGWVSPTTTTFDGDSVLETCQRRADLMVRTLLRAMP